MALGCNINDYTAQNFRGLQIFVGRHFDTAIAIENFVLYGMSNQSHQLQAIGKL